MLTPTHAPLRFLRHAVLSHMRLLAAVALGLAVAVLVPDALMPHAITRLLVAWNVGTCAYLALVALMCVQSSPDTIRRRARVQAESRTITLLLVVLAAAAGLVAIFAQLATVKSLTGADKTAHLALAGLTILSSWAITHTMFALLYAHDYYEAASRSQPVGLLFPGADSATPDYGDFLYCAFIIGTSGQTADVSFTSQPMRRLGLVHSVLSFLFNTTVLATTINITASLF
jgi:uncharacterized membrane protein